MYLLAYICFFKLQTTPLICETALLKYNSRIAKAMQWLHAIQNNMKRGSRTYQWSHLTQPITIAVLTQLELEKKPTSTCRYLAYIGQEHIKGKSLQLCGFPHRAESCVCTIFRTHWAHAWREM